MTGCGVTAGIDFDLTLVARLRDPTCAQAVQLLSEYDPAPPLQAGSPERAPAEVTSLITSMHVDFVDEVRRASEAAARRMLA
jgi:cyclohexyl-isocyanide hydratase